ncbi:dipeptide/tripeptide permease DtpA [Kistimonas asteriae]|uniref:dipeptide/tripeptide permease DtpA n=1 Tax=Kistimonas asteriae TaxID=517724 RepID=UPI001BA816CC|nr:dipeptide/tripeptide permease DtpA [Kistimonas asteriae]
MSQSTNVLRQPKPFYMIFFLELWERFGYYGLQALLAVYFVKQLGMDDTTSFTTFGAFSALVFGLVAIGGFIGDRVIGTKRTMVLGALVLASGYLLMGLADHDHHLVYLALGCIAVGNGLFKANPSSLLSKCYEEGDKRLDGAFTMYYMAINIGSFISMILVPILTDRFGWSVGFFTCTLGMILSVASYWFLRSWVDGIGSAPDLAPLDMKKMVLVLAGTVAAIFLSAWMLQNLTVAHVLLAAVSSLVVVIFLKEIIASKGTEQKKMIAALIMMLQAVVFFVLYMQMPTSLNFFAINNVEHSILGMAINPVTFQSLNPFWIMLASPILAYLYNRMGNTGRDLSMPMKFAIGMTLCATSFLILPLGAQFANHMGIVSSGWIIASYFFQAIGELLISGLGLAMVAQLVPQRLTGFIMGAWFLTSAAASVIGGFIASMTTVPSSNGAVDALQTLPVYSKVFLEIGLAAAVMAGLMLLTAPLLARMINGDENMTEHAATAH